MSLLNRLPIPFVWLYAGTDGDGVALYRSRITGRTKLWSWKVRRWL